MSQAEPATPKRAREAQRPARVSDVRSPPKKRLKEAGDPEESLDESDGAPHASDADVPRVRADPAPAPPPAPVPAPPRLGIAVDDSDDVADATDGGVAAIAARARRARLRTLLSAEQKRERFQKRYQGMTAEDILGKFISGR